MSLFLQNVSVTISNFVLVGLIEIESFRYLCAPLALALFSITLFMSSMIVYITWTEKSLHEPMYIFICILVINGMLGNLSYYPKLIIDLLSRCSTISFTGCFFQSFCIQLYVVGELFLFTVMAYDRYLAVGHPLRYHNLMTNFTPLIISLAIYIFILVTITVGVLLTLRLTFCEVNINNIYCEIAELQRLACNDITVNIIYGLILTFSTIIACLLVIIYSYIRTIVICLKLSRESSQKAIHTLLTHILSFSIYIVTLLFISLRSRINWGSVSTNFHVIIALIGSTIVSTANPLIYGIRTKALREKIVCNLQKMVGKTK
ncbi:olfactory receptor 51E1-like [Rana temporaria]|uniref:olfactory receptor 51E1-like n=1 Tax=Rana temporaria TaxID=8407 RepID=UPI001AAD7A60|nr:olfactory receptor 51E1-like [Rana temporaria]